jgi:hypothetical protein
MISADALPVILPDGKVLKLGIGLIGGRPRMTREAGSSNGKWKLGPSGSWVVAPLHGSRGAFAVLLGKGGGSAGVRRS